MEPNLGHSVINPLSIVSIKWPCHPLNMHVFSTERSKSQRSHALKNIQLIWDKSKERTEKAPACQGEVTTVAKASKSSTFGANFQEAASVTGDCQQTTAAPPPWLAPTMTPTTVSTMPPTCSHAAQPVPPPIPCHTTPLKRGLHLPSRGAGSFSRRQDEPVHAAARLPCARRREPTMHTASVHHPRWPRGSP